ncbi:MAG: hypothetical protein RL701_508, partial [Pseudomonadota bacterium]
MRHAAWVGVLLLLFMPARGFAQADSAREAPPAYREHIAKALQEFSLGHWSEARVYFAEAHALWPNARTFRGLGMACYEARDYSEAIDFLEQALQNSTQPLTPKLAAESRDILQQAKRFVANVRIDVVPANAVITIDDRALVRRPDGGTMLNPGEHQLDVSADGFQDLHRSFMAEAGQSLRVHHKLTPLGATAVANPGDPGSGVAAT